MKKLKKQLKKLKKASNCIQSFFIKTKKNYQIMKLQLSKIFACIILFCMCVMLQCCNVTRKVTTESSYYQKGDTTTTIVTKTIESYDASKKGM